MTAHEGDVSRRRDLRAQVPAWRAAKSCPEYLPTSFDAEARCLVFSHTARESTRDAAFLIPRFTGSPGGAFRINIDDLAAALPRDGRGAGTTNFVFISAFCCSTLLARYLDLIPGVLVLREPGVLGQLALLRLSQRGRRCLGAWDEGDWAQWVEVCLAMLSGVMPGERVVIIKAADICNIMIDAMISGDERRKAVLLSVGLRTFILSILKSESRRAWMRTRVRFWRGVALPSGLPRLEPRNDAEGSAYLWIVTHRLWRRYTSLAGPSRFLPMDGELVSERPFAALRSAGRFLGLGLEDADILRVVGGSTGGAHAKKGGRRYGAAARARDLACWESRLGNAANRGIDWLRRVTAPEDLVPRAWALRRPSAGGAAMES